MIRTIAIIVIVVLLYKLYYVFASRVIEPALMAATEKIAQLIEKSKQKK